MLKPKRNIVKWTFIAGGIVVVSVTGFALSSFPRIDATSVCRAAYAADRKYNAVMAIDRDLAESDRFMSDEDHDDMMHTESTLYQNAQVYAQSCEDEKQLEHEDAEMNALDAQFSIRSFNNDPVERRRDILKAVGLLGGIEPIETRSFDGKLTVLRAFRDNREFLKISYPEVIR